LKKILIAIPYTKFIDTDCWLSLLNSERPADTMSEVRAYARYSVAMGRNAAALDAINGGFDYLFFVDSDEVLEEDTLTRLLDCDADVAVGWYLSGDNRNDTNITHYDATANQYPLGYSVDIITSRNEPFQIDAAGLGAALIKVDIFAALSYPYFNFVEYASGLVLSEDLFFFDAIRTKGLTKKIVCDPAARVGHIKKHII